MTPFAHRLIDAHYSGQDCITAQWYDSVGALIMLAILADRRGITDQEFETLAQQIRAARDCL